MPERHIGLKSKPRNVDARHHPMSRRVHIPTPSDLAARGAGVLLDQQPAFVHELANLIDGTARTLDLALTSISPGSSGERFDSALRLLTTANISLRRAAATLEALKRGLTGLKPVLDGERFTLAESASHAGDLLRPMAESMGALIRINIQGEVAELPAGDTFTILTNGIRNALESLNGPGTVEVSALLDAENLVIDVADDGPGPNAAAKAKAFESGYSTKGSAGIGLALCRELVELAGGRITLSARADVSLAEGYTGAVLRTVIPIQRPRGPGAGWQLDDWGE